MKQKTKTSLVYKAIDHGRRFIFRLTNWPDTVPNVEAPRAFLPRLRESCRIGGIDCYHK